MELTLSQFFFDTPIYEEVVIDKAKDKNLFLKLLGFLPESFDGYNPLQGYESSFTIHQSFQAPPVQVFYGETEIVCEKFINSGGYLNILLLCKRSESLFTVNIFYNSTNNTLTKTGQYPSIADFHLHELKQYRKVIPADKLKEFSKAIGLAANGVGIGSFVYLRRIFEYLIFDAFEVAKGEGVVSDADFQTKRMDQKIELLKNYLPSFLVENIGMYSILSLGIHELSEESCLQHFDALRVGIEIILDEKLEELKKKEKIEEAKKKIATIKSGLKG
ncbi:MAG: short-chain dehydrogenase [Bacteroidota bacterium]